MDRASIIVDAINYIRELEENAKSLQNELIQLEHKDSQKNKQHLKISPLERKNDDTTCRSLVQHDRPTLILGEEKPSEVGYQVSPHLYSSFLKKKPTNKTYIRWKEYVISCVIVFPRSKCHQVEVEVMQINERDFIIKLFCVRKQGGVVRSIEAMDSLGLQVVDVNITTFGSMVLNIFHVEVSFIYE